MGQIQSPSLGKDKNNEHDRGYDHVQTEKTTDAIDKQLMNEERKIETVLEQPRDKLPIG